LANKPIVNFPETKLETVGRFRVQELRFLMADAIGVIIIKDQIVFSMVFNFVKAKKKKKKKKKNTNLYKLNFKKKPFEFKISCLKDIPKFGKIHPESCVG
jgi:hypothetical protein